MRLFLVVGDDDDDVEAIGVYSTRELAEKARTRLQELELVSHGYIHERELDSMPSDELREDDGPEWERPEEPRDPDLGAPGAAERLAREPAVAESEAEIAALQAECARLSRALAAARKELGPDYEEMREEREDRKYDERGGRDR